MGKFRKKLKPATKRSTWKKGQSCLSNAAVTKFRDSARDGVIGFNSKPGGLTVDTLKKHDAVQDVKRRKIALNEDFEDDLFSESQDENEFDYTDTISDASSYKTFASDFSQCTNVSYKKIIEKFTPDSAVNKTMLAILSAIDETIKENGGTGTNTEYYCALMTMLEDLLAKEEIPELEVGATLCVISTGIGNVPQDVLRKTFDSSTKIFLSVLKDYSDKESNLIIPSTLVILSHILRSADTAVWSLSCTTQTFGAILNPFCIFTKIRWRKAALRASCSVVKNNYFTQNNLPNNPPADQVAKFCKDVINECLSGKKSSTNIKSQEKTILHVLKLMKSCIIYFSQNQIKSCCELVLQLLTLNYPFVSICSYQVFYQLFSHEKVVVNATLNGQLIGALYDFQPSPLDFSATNAWLLVMQKAHTHLVDADLAMGATSITKAFGKLVELWLSNDSNTNTAITHALNDLVRDVLVPMCESKDSLNRFGSKVKSCLDIIQSCLSYQFRSVWQNVLFVIKTVFEVLGKIGKNYLKNLLTNLVELHDSNEFQNKNEAEYVIGAAVRHSGPEFVLQIVPLTTSDGKINLNRTWMLPILKKNVHSSTLKFWHDNIYFLGVSCANSSNSNIAFLQNYFWELFPSFCNKPSDIKTSFGQIAKNLGNALRNANDTCIEVMAGIRKLINYAKENELSEDIHELARFDKNFLPLLMNLILNCESGMEKYRYAALETMKLYLFIAKPELIISIFEKAFKEYLHLSSQDTNATENETVQMQCLVDTIKLLVKYQDHAHLETIYNACIKNLSEIKSHKGQKKAYQLLEEILICDSEESRNFILNHYKSIEEILLNSIKKVKNPSKASMLRCFYCTIQACRNNISFSSKIVQGILPVAIVCCKDWNSRCKSNAFSLINLIGSVISERNETDALIQHLVSQVDDIDNVEVVSASILALSTLLHEFTGGLGVVNIELMFNTVCAVFSNSNRDIVSSCLIFMKTFCQLPYQFLGASLKEIIKAITSMTDDCKNHFRIRHKHILQRLIRKFGYESVSSHFENGDDIIKKISKNINKNETRRKGKKESNVNLKEEGKEDSFSIAAGKQTMEEILADSDDEDLEEENYDKKQNNTYIQEDADTIVDFTDLKTISKISSVKPKNKEEIATTQAMKKKKKDSFKTDLDGRLIITNNTRSDDEDEAETATKKFKNLLLDNDTMQEEDDESDNDGDNLTLDLGTSRKRKRSECASVKTGTSWGSMRYRSGGAGIHRPVSNAASIASTYKSKNGKSDIKKKGKVDPYAYVPLQRQLLNKRNKKNQKKQFKKFIGK